MIVPRIHFWYPGFAFLSTPRCTLFWIGIRSHIPRHLYLRSSHIHLNEKFPHARYAHRYIRITNNILMPRWHRQWIVGELRLISCSTAAEPAIVFQTCGLVSRPAVLFRPLKYNVSRLTISETEWCREVKDYRGPLFWRDSSLQIQGPTCIRACMTRTSTLAHSICFTAFSADAVPQQICCVNM